VSDTAAEQIPDEVIRRVESSCQRFETPCGDGSVVWRRWGNGLPLLLLHGGSGSWLHWLPSIPALAQHFAVWVPDLPGMGDSAMPPEPVSFDSYAEVLLEGINTYRSAGDPVSIVGFSFGASFTVRLASLLPTKHVALSGATFIEMKERARRNLFSLRKIADEAERAKALRHNLGQMMIAHEENIDALALRIYDLDTRRRRLPRTAVNNLPVIRAELPKLEVQGRIAVISGADDQVVGGGTQTQKAELATLRPDAPYIAIPGAGHWVMKESPEAYNRALLDHLLS
jgi:pimeloyl-ACP methyl ester carboxylesterase